MSRNMCHNLQACVFGCFWYMWHELMNISQSGSTHVAMARFSKWHLVLSIEFTYPELSQNI